MSWITQIKREDASVPAPAVGSNKIRWFVGMAGRPRAKDETNTVFDFTGPTGSTGPQGPMRKSNSVSLLDYATAAQLATNAEAALNAAIADLPNGGTVEVPGGGIKTVTAPYTISANNITIRGAGTNATTWATDATTGDQVRFTGYGCALRDMTILGPGSAQASAKTSGVGVKMESTEGHVSGVNFAYQYDCLMIGGHLVDVEDLVCRYYKNSGVIVNHNSDHRIVKLTTDNNVASLPTGAGIDVQVTASLVIDKCNIIHANFALNVSPAQGVTIPSIKAVETFFDTSAVGVNFTGAGSVFRSEFTNCWMSTMTTAGIRIQPALNGTVDGITFVNCNVLNNVTSGGNPVGSGFLLGGSAGNVGKISVSATSIAGWASGVSISGGGTSMYPMLTQNFVGAISSFAANTVGIAVATGTYKGLIIQNNQVVDNGTSATFGTVTLTAATAAAFQSLRVTDNPGINPRGTVVAPAVPASAGVAINNTGFRVLCVIKGGVTSVVTVNGVATPSVLAAGNNLAVTLEPGSTIAMTYTTAPTWVWVGQ